ncbi:MAG: tetratricopeptide repeat protein [Deltaproteobacteria bacterium]|nr:tetratricopeptide repeat protein [Deltaproteobacteria bacterium]
MKRLLAISGVVLACGPKQGSPLRTHPPVEASAQASSESEGAGSVIHLEPLRIDVSPGPGGEARVYDARTLLEEGNESLVQGQYDVALQQYDRLVRDFPGSSLIPAALYNAGLASEGKGDFTTAAERYRNAIERIPPGSRDSLDAHYRLGAVLAELRQFADSSRIFESVLDHENLSVQDRMEALARLGYALVELGDFSGAEEVLRGGIKFRRDLRPDEALDSPYFVAMCQYYLGDIPRRQFEAIPLRLPAQQLDLDIEQKSELFLLARDRYMKTVEYGDPNWGTAAVFQIGTMYREFWNDFMAVPVPPDLTGQEVDAYVKLVNENQELRRLLEKSILYHERNIAMSKRARVDSPWTEASLVAVEEVLRIVAGQQKGEYIRPGTPTQRRETNAGAGTGPATRPDDYIPARLNL